MTDENKQEINVEDRLEEKNLENKTSEPESIIRDMERNYDMFTRNIGNLFGTGFGTGWGNLTGTMNRPLLDIEEKDDMYRACAELPGIKRDDVKLKLKSNNLEIKAQNTEITNKRDSDFVVKERVMSTFKRSIRVPEEVDTENIVATMKHGVLTIDMPKKDSVVSKNREIIIE